MNIKQMAVRKMVQIFIEIENEEPDEKLILAKMEEVIVNNNILLNKEEFNEVYNSLRDHFAIVMSIGQAICGDEIPDEWYTYVKEQRHDTNCSYWDRYKEFLSDENFPKKVIDSIDKDTDKITNLLGDPSVTYKYSRKGLVIGDVQSGKTANYIAVMNKAADAGYKIIILLAGTIEKLRKQTQERVDKGFIGNNGEKQLVGVRQINSKLEVSAFTSTKNDFKEQLKTITLSLSSLTNPLVFVVKKNKTILESLFQWLKNENIKYGSENSEKTIDYPLLLIDDEADNASINTNIEENDPTAINRAIRKILGVFTKSSYLAYTATPYANIFINPNTSDDMVKDDLFPKDYIYVLDTPNNYIGAKEMYSDTGKYRYMLHQIDDFEEYLPIKHKKDSEVGYDLPDSLKKAILSFFIANAIRDIRGQKTSHRSMLINVSRFVKIHNELEDRVEDYVNKVKYEIEHYSLTPNWYAHKHLSALEDVYNTYFVNTLEDSKEKDWEVILSTLYDSTRGIIVEAVNSNSAATKLNYNAYKSGYRVIAIGGLSLSRGLTLEGLMTSYFYRNSKMYDTLMQMGRWFGYRSGYDDLCQVWMNEDSLSWYKDISTATEELRDELKQNFEAGWTPKEFGIKVRSDEAALLVTARNKMRSAEDYELDLDLEGNYIETPAFSVKEKTINANYDALDDFINQLSQANITMQKDSKTDKSNSLNFIDVPKDMVFEFLKSVDIDIFNRQFDKNKIVSILNSLKESKIELWDVIFASGKSNFTTKILNHEINYVVRSYNEFRSERIRLNKNRLGAPGVVNSSLSQEAYEELLYTLEKLGNDKVKDGKKLTTIGDKAYFSTVFNRKPVLVIYLVQYPREVLQIENNADSNMKPLVGLGVGIPRIGHGKRIRFKYKVNQKWFEDCYDIENIEDYEELEE